MPRRNLPIIAEALEPRRLFATAWGAFPQLIDQDLAVSSYAQYNGAGQTIAIIDTGIDYTHPAVAGKYLTGYDFVDNDSDPMDVDGHGTAIASIVAGNQYTYNGVKYQGVASGARIIALRVEAGGVSNATVPDSRYEAAFQWIVANRTKYNIVAVNGSFGDGHYSTEAQRTVYADEMKTLMDAGVVIATSSGNDGVQSPYGVEYPAADPSAFAVGSVNTSDLISKWTERGAIMDILAPGENVPVAYLDSNLNHTYILGSGTSFSSPYIAGAAAIIKQIDPSFTAHDVMSILRASGVDNYDGDGEASPYTTLTWPRLDLDNAIATALQRKKGQASVSTIGVDGRENGLKFDRDGVLYYAWYDSATRHLEFATQQDDGQWSGVTTIDGGSDAGHYVSLAMTSTGKPAVAYYDAYNADLKYSIYNGKGWSTATVDSKLSTGMYPSLTFDRYDNPLITYYYKTGGDLRAAYNDGSAWSVSTIESTNDVGRYSSVALTSAGQWTVACKNTTNGTFRFAQNPEAGGALSTFDGVTKQAGGFISLAYDGSSIAHISYYDAYNADLKYAPRQWKWLERGDRGVESLAGPLHESAPKRLNGTDSLF
ncbi:MAG: S8 family serine peptidase [Verrucomicrobiota bacterium]